MRQPRGGRGRLSFFHRQPHWQPGDEQLEDSTARRRRYSVGYLGGGLGPKLFKHGESIGRRQSDATKDDRGATADGAQDELDTTRTTARERVARPSGAAARLRRGADETGTALQRDHRVSTAECSRSIRHGPLRDLVGHNDRPQQTGSKVYSL